ncbi:MAG: M4 family metallopeptidase [Vicinamibacteria bacterium]
MLCLLAPSSMAQTAATASRAIEALNTAAGVPLTVTRSPKTQLATFLSAPRGRSIPLPASAGTSRESRALSFVETYGAAFGLRNAADVRIQRVETDSLGLDHVRMTQVRAGVPVTGGELVLHMKGARVLAANGKTLGGIDGVDLNPAVSAPESLSIAGKYVARKFKTLGVNLSEPRLEILNQELLGGRPFPTRLAWFIEASSMDLRQFIWIDAHSKLVLLSFSQRTDAKNRAVYNGNNLATLPGTLVRSEGDAATGDTDADLAYVYAGSTYDYYSSVHGRDSFDGLGGQLKSTVHHCPTGSACPYENAFWSGTQMVYGDGYASADDVVAHELTHAVTERTANLFYYMQSGALNESFSDIFGETVDLLNGLGTDTLAVRWEMGEDLPDGGALRNMANPNLFNDPGKMTDSQFRCEYDPVAEDAGGVHTNSGVPNHAYALMVDGGTYNAQTVVGIGLTKAAKVQYRALTQYLTSASDFLDNYNALQQACSDLVGTDGITAGDCSEVTKALNAVQMSNPWPCGANYGMNAPPPNVCPAGQYATNTFFDGFETGLSNWTISGNTGTWFRGSNPVNPLGGSVFATTGADNLWGYSQDTATDSRISLASNLSILPGSRLQFNHSFGFDNDSGGNNWDGGRIEYSTDNGVNWSDLSPLYAAGANYGTGAIKATTGNPIGGLMGFVKDSFGYTASQYNLGTLGGQNVRFRFRIGTDSSIDDYGWFIDDFRVYQCFSITPPTISIADVSVLEGNAGMSNATFTLSLSAPFASTVSVTATTADSTATAGSDYTAAGPTVLNFAPGVTTQTFSVPIQGDAVIEGNETFFVNLTDPLFATIADGQAVGTIVDDDTEPNVTPTSARFMALDSSARTTLGGTTPEIWYAVQLFANRSYQFSAWPVADDETSGAVSISLDLFSDASGTVAATPSPRKESAGLEGSPNQSTGRPQTLLFQPTTSGVYRLRLTGVAGTPEDVSLLARETTLFSPWLFVTNATSYDAFQTIHNNTAQPVVVTLQALDASGTALGNSITFTVPADATVFKSTKSDMGVAADAFGGTLLRHDGAFGAISANTTTLSGLTGLSFDSPFTPRSSQVLGSPIR